MSKCYHSVPNWLFVFTLLFFLCMRGYAYAEVPDSLKQRIDSLVELSSSTQGMDKYEADFKIAWDLFDIDNAIALRHAEFAHGIAAKTTDTLKILQSGRLYAQLLRRDTQFDEAEKIFVQLIPLTASTVGRPYEGKVLSSLAVLYTLKAKFDLAAVYNLKALRIWERDQDTFRLAVTLDNIGLNYYKMGSFSEAVSYFERASVLGDSLSKSNATVNLALAKLFVGEHEAFPDLARKAQALSPPLVSERIRAAAESGFGIYFLKRDSPDSAERHVHCAIEYSKKADDKYLIAEAESLLAQCAIQQGKPDAAIKILTAIERSSSAGLNVTRLVSYERLAKAYEMKGDLAKALAYRTKQIVLQDSMYAQNVQNNIAIARIEFEEQQNEALIAKQAEIIALKTAVIDRQRLLGGVGALLLVTLVVLVIVLRKFNAYQKRISIELDQKVADRTRELKRTEEVQMRMINEQALLLGLISSKVLASIATFRGLWKVVALQSPEWNALVTKFECAADDLLQVSSIVDKSKALRFTGDVEVPLGHNGVSAKYLD